MRRFIGLTFAGLVVSTPLAAQFEGTITMKLAAAGQGGQQGDMIVKMAMSKSGKMATIMSMPASAGPMAGQEVRTIFDPANHTSTVLMPIPPGMGASMPQMANAKGMKMVMDMSKMQTSSTESADGGSISKLGTSETIIGLSCDDYEWTDKEGQKTRMCLTSSLGKFIFPQTGGGMGRRGGGNNAPPAWTNAFGDKAVFPLKVWRPDGKMDMEVTAIDKSAVSASTFDVPDGYVDMSAMMSGMRGRPPLDR